MTTLFIVFYYYCSNYNPLDIEIPDISEATYAIAKNYHYLDKSNEAEKMYISALCLNPENSTAFNDLGVLFMESGDNERALKYYKKAMNLDASNKQIKNNYYSLLEKINKK